jgi:hypothetical protein
MRKTLLVATMLGLATSAWGAVVVNPTLVTGPDSIDPVQPNANAGVRDATGLVAGAASKGDLTSVPGFSVIQTFTGFTGAATSSVNIFSFTDPTMPDIRITSKSYNGSGGGNTTAFTTSGTSAQFIGSGGYPGDSAQVIEFGTYDPTLGTFAADREVNAVGFMITQNANAVNRTWNVKFLDASLQQIGNLQTSPGGSNAALLFGTVLSDNLIRRVELDIDGGGDAGTFMDDLGFAVVIPEPASLGALALTGLAMLRRR